MVAATLILMITFGARQNYGLFMAPISVDHPDWGREVFSFAIALQTLIWGLSQPLWGVIADRYGAGRVVSISGMLYAAGLYLMGTSTTPFEITFSTSFLTGVAMSGASFPILLAVVGRSVTAERRSLFLGIASAGGSSGQFIMVPLGQYFISSYGYVAALFILAAVVALTVPLAAAVAGKRKPADEADAEQGVIEALGEAVKHGGFLMLVAGFFVCGFQTMFIGAHLPVYLTDQGAPAWLGAATLSAIGLFNMLGCFLWGWAGDRYPRKYLLAWLYIARSAVIIIFLLMPFSVVSAIVFAAAMGMLWLGTVPLTSGLVAQIFGTQYMAMLYGFVFLNHQLGSFVGIWLGGLLYDRTGSYDVIWWIAISLGLIAGLIHYPIDDRAVARISAPKGA